RRYPIRPERPAAAGDDLCQDGPRRNGRELGSSVDLRRAPFSFTSTRLKREQRRDALDEPALFVPRDRVGYRSFGRRLLGRTRPESSTARNTPWIPGGGAWIFWTRHRSHVVGGVRRHRVCACRQFHGVGLFDHSHAASNGRSFSRTTVFG